jgi:Uma2 family endonuclease
VVSGSALSEDLLAHYTGQPLSIRISSCRLRIPDVCIMPSEWKPRLRAEGYVTAIPLVAAEVRSPSDKMPQVLEKIENLLLAGVRQVFLLRPEKCCVTKYWLQDGAVHSRKCDRAILAVSPAIEMEFDAVWRDEE